MRILVVEDDRKVASFIQTGLEQEGYAVDVLHDGGEAGEQARMVDYDCVVLDLMLPGRSGFQVLRDIRARKAELPVLILTAKDVARRAGHRPRRRRRRLHGQAVRARRAVGADPGAAAARHAGARRSCGSPISRSTPSAAASRGPAGRSISSRRNTRCSSS